MPPAYDSDLARKLNLPSGMTVRVIAAPEGVELSGLAVAEEGEAVLAFARTRDEVDRLCEPALAAAREDRIAWIAYPKGGQLGTDLNRDILWGHLQGRGVRPVRQVALDGVWSALRFRPAGETAERGG